jgi:hypothetical protein
MQVAPANSYTVSAAAWAGGILTLTVANTFGLRAGEYITLSGFVPTTINASFKVDSVVVNTSIKIAIADPGTITDGVGTATRDAPHNTTNMVKRIYRAVTTTANADYYFVREIPVATTSTTDNAGANIGAPIQTSTWFMPPAGLQGITSHPSGAMVGFVGNQVCMSVPSAPYAWPIANQSTVNYPVVNVGVFDNTVVVGTQGTPYVMQGTDPSTMYATQVGENWPCLSKRSLVDFGFGVAYAAPQGVVMVSGSGPQILTNDFYTAIEWAAVVPTTVIAAAYDGRYYARYTKSSGAGGMMVLDLRNPIGVTHLDIDPSEIWSDPVTSKLYVTVGSDIQEWDADLSLRMTATWQSKEYLMATPLSLGVAKVEADFAGSSAEEVAIIAANAATQASNAALIAANGTGGSVGGASLGAYSWGGSAVRAVNNPSTQITFELYANGSLYYSTPVGHSNVFRLPSGEKYYRWSVRVITPVAIKSILLAETSIGLKSV